MGKKCKIQEYRYKDFVYMMNENCNHIIKSEKEFPKSVYKYYGMSDYSIDALMKGYLYATHPFMFNDIMDSSMYLLDFSEMEFDVYKSLWKQMIIISEYEKYDWQKEYERDKKVGFKNVREMFYFFFTKSMGTICLTEEPLNNLMWGHYAGENGFVIELDIDKCIEEKEQYNSDIEGYCYRPIQYVEELEKIGVIGNGFKNPDVPILYMNNVKMQEWNYEKEWRLTIYKNNMGVPFSNFIPNMKDYKGSKDRKFYYSHKNIKKIILGNNFFNGENLINGYSNGEIELKYCKKREIDFVKLVNYLYKNFNDRIFMSGTEEGKKNIKRYFEKIYFEKIKHNKFKIIRSLE